MHKDRVHEVTQKQYEAVMKADPSHFNTARGGSPEHPVEEVTWEDATEFCAQLSQLPEEKRHGRAYRLPTEAEREYACRAGTTTNFSVGDTLRPDQANFAESKLGMTTKIGSYAPNAFGLFDMHGNAWEWCADWYEPGYDASVVDDPKGPKDGTMRVLRGGCAPMSPAVNCRSFYRGWRAPADKGKSCGLRMLIDVPEPVQRTPVGLDLLAASRTGHR
jgi:formylglycine-generating enzyme required for sulfatase activity